jgi:carotenoid cleavage dioxygenase-like enzyme
MLTMITSSQTPATSSANPSKASSSAPAIAPARPAPALDLSKLLWTRGLDRNHDLGPAIVEGTLPDDLRGTLYRNGPGQFEVFGTSYKHPFEGDGAVTALRLGDGAPRAGSHIHDTAGLLEERAAGKALYGFNAPWLRRIANGLRGKDKNTANTNVMWWNGRLFALMEGAKPTELDPRTLATIGETDLDGVVVSMFSAHPHRSARRRTTYNFGLKVGRKMGLCLYALPDDGPARMIGTIPLDGAYMVHDFIATDDHLVFFVAPARINVPRALLNIGDFTSFVGWKPELGTEVIVVPIDDPARMVRFHTEAFFQWHFTNAYTRPGAAGEIVVEYVRYPDFQSFYDLGGIDHGGPSTDALALGRYHRAVIDVAHKAMRSEMMFDGSCEFPRVHPAVEGAPHRFAWMSRGDLDGIARFDATTGAVVEHRVGPHQRVSEPIFVPRAGARPGDEADGHVLSLCYDGARDESFVAVYDGARLADGPVARVWLGYAVPITFHGIWVPAA